MLMKCTAVCLLALALLGSYCDAQWGGIHKPAKPAYQKPSPPVKQEPVKQTPQVPQQERQSFEKPLLWKYPTDPQPEPAVEVPFELRHPVPAATVAVECRESEAYVQVKKDMFGIGQDINPADLTLGNCAAVAEDNAAQAYIYLAELHNCLSTLTMTEDSLIYTFTLNYNPQPVGTAPVVRTSQAAVIVECHYPRHHVTFDAGYTVCENMSDIPYIFSGHSLRFQWSSLRVQLTVKGMSGIFKAVASGFSLGLAHALIGHVAGHSKHNVSSLPLDPLWIPFSAVKVAEEFLYFTLKLMTDDWQYERPSYQYFLGDIINIEAVVRQFFHVPLRVYVDNCVATLSPDVSSSPRYAFIDNHGCMLDGRLTGSDSKFIARSADYRLQFQLEAFRFQGADSGLLYITCHLKATSASHAIDSECRACSYMNGWKEASGVDAACGNCESAGLGPLPDTKSSGLGPLPSNPSGGAGSGTSTGTWGAGGSLSKPGRKIRGLSEVFELEGDVTLGPIHIEEKVVA